MTFAMSMRHHRPVQLVEAGAPERAMRNRVSGTHRFPPKPLLGAVFG
jgi:hypothetical protein